MLSDRYAAEMKMESSMCCGNEGPRPTIQTVQQPGPDETAAAGMVRALYNGPTGRHEVVGIATKQRYGYRQGGETFYVYIEDYQAQPDIYQPITEINTNEATADPGAPQLLKV
jgi:hypothetical protein